MITNCKPELVPRPMRSNSEKSIDIIKITKN